MKPCRFNRNPTLLKTIRGSSSQTINKPQYRSICSSCSLSFQPHLLVSLPTLSWLSRICPKQLATPLMRSHSLKPLSPPLQRFFSAWKTLARLFNTVISTETHLNHHFLQEAFSDSSNLYHIFPSPELWEHALYLIIFLFWASSTAKHTRYLTLI